MNPAEEALFDQILQVEADIARRKEIKDKNEKEEKFAVNSSEIIKPIALSDTSFLDAAKKAQEANQPLNARTEFKASFNPGDLKEVDGGYEVEVLLLEDGYIPGRVVFQKGSTGRAVDLWKDEKSALLVNDSHIGVDYSIVLGTIGAITDLRTEKFAGSNSDKKDRTRAYANVFLNMANPVTKYIVETGRKLNEELKKRGKDYAIFSVSAEVRFNRFAFTEFGDDFVFSADDYRFTGMAVCFNPANLSSFGTVADLSGSEFKLSETMQARLAELSLSDEQVSTLLDNIKKSPTLSYLLSHSDMGKKELEKKLSDVEAPETETPAETPVESEVPVEETPAEVPEAEKVEEAPEAEKEADPADTKGEEDSDAGEELAATTKVAAEALALAEQVAKENINLKTQVAELSTQLQAYKAALDTVDGSVASRVPASGKKSDELSIAQRTSKEGKRK